MTAICLIPTDLRRGRLGQPAWLSDRLGSASVLEHTVRRAARVAGVAKIVLVHPAGQDPLALLRRANVEVPIAAHADENGLEDAHTPRWVAARKWAPHAWRGGLGGATCFDELLPAAPLARALRAHAPAGVEHPSAFVVRADWCLFDPELASAVLARHLEQPAGYKLVFTQAPPGLCGIAIRADLLDAMATPGSHASFATMLGYVPTAPAADPIGRDPCIAVDAAVRDCAERFIYDTPRGVALLRAVAAGLGGGLADADSRAVVAAAGHARGGLRRLLPSFISLEATPRREVSGPITPHGHATFDRPDHDLDLAAGLVEEIAEMPDSCLLLGGPAGGDAMLHPRWDQIVLAAARAGVTSVGIETDLLGDPSTIDRLLDLPIDLITVRLNADTAATYHRVMGADRFGEVIRNLERLLNERNRRRVSGDGALGLPWVLPRMVKTVETLPEMETFFDKWTHYAGHAVIERARCGCGPVPLMPDQSPVPMAPPRRAGAAAEACRQLGRRLTILSSGLVAGCDGDWLGLAPLGDATIEPLADIAARAEDVREGQLAGTPTDPTLCGQCSDWHRG